MRARRERLGAAAAMAETAATESLCARIVSDCRRPAMTVATSCGGAGINIRSPGDPTIHSRLFFQGRGFFVPHHNGAHVSISRGDRPLG